LKLLSPLNDFAQNYERIVTVEQLLNGERVDALAAFSSTSTALWLKRLKQKRSAKTE
jgi:hypothetical protein